MAFANAHKIDELEKLFCSFYVRENKGERANAQNKWKVHWLL